MANFSITFPDGLLAGLKQKAAQIGMTDSELVRLSVASFLSKEDALDEYLAAIDTLDKKLAIMLARQEKFARVLGTAAMQRDAEKTPESRQKLGEFIADVIETVR